MDFQSASASVGNPFRHALPKWLPQLTIAVISIISLAACQSTANQPHQTTIAADESPILFAHPDGLPMRAQFQRRIAADYTVQTVNGFWRPIGESKYPIIRITFHSLEPGYFFTKFSSDVVEEFVSKLEFGTLGKAIPGEISRIRNVFGLANIQQFKLPNLECFAFEQIWGGTDSISAQGTERLIGFYCHDPYRPLSDDYITQVVRSIGVKGHRIPEHVAKASQSQTRDDTLSAALTLVWTGHYDNAKGRLLASNPEGKNGRMAVTLPGKSGSCSGSWEVETGGYEKSEAPKGTWKILCTNGLQASGTFESPRRGYGAGTGNDTDGAAVSFTFEPSGREK